MRKFTCPYCLKDHQEQGSPRGHDIVCCGEVGHVEPAHQSPFQVGVRVGLKRHMLQMGFPNVYGTIVSIFDAKPERVMVDWDGEGSTTILVSNLILRDRIHLEPV